MFFLLCLSNVKTEHTHEWNMDATCNLIVSFAWQPKIMEKTPSTHMDIEC